MQTSTESKMQRKKNIRLLIILVALILVTIVVFFIGGERNSLDIERDQFSFKETEQIDKVVIKRPEGTNILNFERNQWNLNDSLDADPQRISVLFAIIQQMKVRREVSNATQGEIQRLFEQGSTQVELYAGIELRHVIRVLGAADKGLTYVADKDSYYLVEIPGYKSYLAGIFELDQNGWRNPVVFDFNWTNLQKVDVTYQKEANSFNIVYAAPYYKVAELEETDSLKLTDFLDDVSLLYVNDYLTAEEHQSYDSLKVLQAKIVITDVGQNSSSLEVYDRIPSKDERLVRIDSINYAIINSKMLNRALKPRNFFKKKDL